MKRIVIAIYERFRKTPLLGWSIFIVLTALLVALIMRLNFKEDISDFLPMDEHNRTALSVYQDVSGANKIFAIVSTRDTVLPDPEVLTAGADDFAERVETADSLNYIGEIMGEVDMDRMFGIMETVYENIPYFLTDKDYERIDSLLSNKEYMRRQIEENKQMLLFPSSNLMSDNIARDPLNLFSPVLGRLRNGGVGMDFDLHDGHILTPDGRRAIVIMESTFGAHESEHNAELIKLLEDAAAASEKGNANLDIRIIGGPAIAVGNANQIKKDSILAVSIAGVLIMLLLIYVFRNLRNILLILVSVGWGWLFAMGAIALYYDSVSIIVIGIASVILGIAVNYPLHLIDHLKDSERPKEALKEIIAPLVVGNVTTVGAFLCLVPLNSPALHDLGLFASLLLVGTIFFVLFFLPQVVKRRRGDNKTVGEPKLIAALSGLSIENSSRMVWVVLVLTCVFGYFSFRTEFDTDMRNINYMTQEQKEDMRYFQTLVDTEPGREDLYVVSSGEKWNDALKQSETLVSTIDSLEMTGMVSRRNEASSFMMSEERQRERLDRWNKFLSVYGEVFEKELKEEGRKAGFNEDAFSVFDDIISADYIVKDFSFFREFIGTVFSGSLSEDTETGRKSVVEVLSVRADKMDEVKQGLENNREFGGLFFDVRSMNGSIANTLSDDFNYIGLVCGCIVFLFLWISLGRIELAVVSFMPMAFSWIWILGIMGILGIKFNIVNVILATFIFGQGDDYTIFMTEGMSYEYAYRRRLLASYKGSIIVSALIMFVGIGTLLFAKHPALRSLGEVTVVGMLSVVLMAYLFPPLMFNWLVRKGGMVRLRPLTIGVMLRIVKRTCRFLFGNRKNRKQDEKQVVMISNKSNLSTILGVAERYHKIAVVISEERKYGAIVRKLLKWRGILIADPDHMRKRGVDLNSDISKKDYLDMLVSQGYCICCFSDFFPMDRRDNGLDSVFDKAIDISVRAGIPIVPVFVTYPGVSHKVERYISEYEEGKLRIGECFLPLSTLADGGDLRNDAERLKEIYFNALEELQSETNTLDELISLVSSQYLYKGRDFTREARKALASYFHDSSESVSNSSFVSLNKGNGEDGIEGAVALMLALKYPEKEISCKVSDPDARALLIGCAAGIAYNLRIE